MDIRWNWKKKIIFPEFLKEIDKNNELGVDENHKVILFYNLRYIESWSLEDPVEWMQQPISVFLMFPQTSIRHFVFSSFTSYVKCSD